ncbi:MAG: DUF4157 domain-containing protein [Dokdonella sp.]
MVPATVLLSTNRFLQRQCTACNGRGGTAETCESCAKEKIHHDADAPGVTASRFGHDFSSVRVHGAGSVRISQPDDPLEREADRVAARVVGGQAVQTISSVGRELATLRREQAAAAPALATQEIESDEELGGDEVEEAPDDAVEVELVGDESGRPKLEAGARADGELESVSIPAGGRPLDAPARHFMERRFDRDFSGVRVHTDSSAADSAERIQAHAYTFGNDIVFGAGRYSPDTSAGQRLLAHELTHVVQQRAGRSSQALQRQPRRDKSKRRRVDGPLKPSGRKRAGTKKKKVPCGAKECDGKCTSAVNPAVHHPWCGNETCPPGPAANSADFIRHLDVDLSTQKIIAEMGTKAATKSKVGPFLSSPNPSTTPVGMHTIGAKCGPCHTNSSGHGMAWFTGFVDLQFGFHNSQRVAAGTHSLGCVRVPCDRAKWIHDNTASAVTTVCVHKGGHCGVDAAKKAGEGKGKQGGKKGKKVEKKKAAPHGGGGVNTAPVAPPLVSANELGDEIFSDEFDESA